MDVGTTDPKSVSKEVVCEQLMENMTSECESRRSTTHLFCVRYPHVCYFHSTPNREEVENDHRTDTASDTPVDLSPELRP